MEYLPAWMFLALTILLMAGFPVHLHPDGDGHVLRPHRLRLVLFDLLPLRIWGVMTNVTLIAVPLFVFMGVMLERSGLAEELLDTMGILFGRLRGGLAIPWWWSAPCWGPPPASWGPRWSPWASGRAHHAAPRLSEGTGHGHGFRVRHPGADHSPQHRSGAHRRYRRRFRRRSVYGRRAPGFLLVGLFVLYIAVISWVKPKWAPAIPKAGTGCHLPR